MNNEDYYDKILKENDMYEKIVNEVYSTDKLGKDLDSLASFIIRLGNAIKDDEFLSKILTKVYKSKDSSFLIEDNLLYINIVDGSNLTVIINDKDKSDFYCSKVSYYFNSKDNCFREDGCYESFSDGSYLISYSKNRSVKKDVCDICVNIAEEYDTDGQQIVKEKTIVKNYQDNDKVISNTYMELIFRSGDEIVKKTVTNNFEDSMVTNCYDRISQKCIYSEAGDYFTASNIGSKKLDGGFCFKRISEDEFTSKLTKYPLDKFKLRQLS